VTGSTSVKGGILDANGIIGLATFVMREETMLGEMRSGFATIGSGRG
jgi:hypothetical protein